MRAWPTSTGRSATARDHRRFGAQDGFQGPVPVPDSAGKFRFPTGQAGRPNQQPANQPSGPALPLGIPDSLGGLARLAAESGWDALPDSPGDIIKWADKGGRSSPLIQAAATLLDDAITLGRIMVQGWPEIYGLEGMTILGRCPTPKGPNWAAWTSISLSNAQSGSNGVSAGSCLSGQASPGAHNSGQMAMNGPPVTIPAARQMIVFSHQYLQVLATRYRYELGVWKPGEANPRQVGARTRIRYRIAYPGWPDPSPVREVGPGRQPGPRLDPADRTQPGITFEITEKGVRPSPRQRPHRRKPPGPGVTEKKFVLAMSTGAIARVVGAAGEFGDFVEAFYSTLPRYLKSKDADTLQERAYIVATNLDKVDYGEAISNLIVNEVQDRAIGRIGQAVARLNRRLGAPGGITLGPAL